MTERLLQFLWQGQFFNKAELTADGGEELQVLSPGQHNTNQGPDFLNAKVILGKTTWFGNVELHIRSSDWVRHRHDADQNYQNVILHVVWENDRALENNIPLLELRERVSKILLLRYEGLMNSAGVIPCKSSIHSVRDIIWKGWRERLMIERLLRKAAIAEILLGESKYHWEETFWWLLARNFGITVNADAFEELARTIPLSLLAKHKNQILQVEAILLGQAGLLAYKFDDHYPVMLQKEYEFYRKKYHLRQIKTPMLFLRMRPGNFPSVRLAQLAQLIHQSAHLFSKIREAESVAEVRDWLDITANDYWHYHYQLGKTSSFKEKKLGLSMVDNILINTIIPMLFAYGHYHKDDKFKQKSVNWLEAIAPESNVITRQFETLHISAANAYESQAYIELKTEYCDKKRCLDCAIGNAILRERQMEGHLK